MNAKKLVESIWNHPAGPRTIHFWAPTFKWAISATNIFNFSMPPDSISYPQQTAFVVAGFIGARYCTVITPKNWNLFSNNFALGCTGIYQLARKVKSKPLLSKEQQQNLSLWAVLFAASLIKNNRLLHEALMSAMSKKATVLECIETTEKAK